MMALARFAFYTAHDAALGDVEIFDLYARLCRECSLGEVSHYWLDDFPNNEMVAGGPDALRARLAEAHGATLDSGRRRVLSFRSS